MVRRLAGGVTRESFGGTPEVEHRNLPGALSNAAQRHQAHGCRHHELRLESPHQNERLTPWWIDNIFFAGRFQIECPATYKPSPNMQTRDCYMRSKHFFSPLKTMFGRFAWL